MSKKNEAASTPAIAPQRQGLAPGASAPTALERPGFSIFIAGSMLKPGSTHWTEAQRETGIWVRGIYLTAMEEEAAIVEAQRDNKLPAIGLYQFRRSFVAVADSHLEAAGLDDDGNERFQRAPGTWQRVPVTSQRGYWEELGPQGRQMFSQAYQLAHTPSEAERAASLASFRLEG